MWLTNTPGMCSCSQPHRLPCSAAGTPARIPLAALPANVAAANPFSLSAQRLKGGASGQPCQQQQASVRFAVEEQCAATPAAVPPSAGWQCGTGGASTAGAGSPSPYVLFRGRLSFAAEVESARKFDRPGASARAAAANERGGKRKLLISPDGALVRDAPARASGCPSSACASSLTPCLLPASALQPTSVLPSRRC